MFFAAFVGELFRFFIFSLHKERKNLPKDTSRAAGGLENFFLPPIASAWPTDSKKSGPKSVRGSDQKLEGEETC